MSFENKVAVITGSTSGIGLAIAKAFAAEGASIMLNGLGTRGDNADAIAAVEAVATGSAKVDFHPANMMDAEQAASLVTDAKERLGGVSMLVNNAGIQHVSPIAEFPTAKWDAILAINLSSAFHTGKAAIPIMRAAGFGRIINMASAHSMRASPGKAAYVAAKHGLVGLTKVLAVETARENITVNAISPGYVWTPLVEKQIPDYAKANGLTEQDAKDEILEKQPTREFATVEQIAALAVFLAGDAAKQITGANYSVDGGWTAQ